MMKRQTKKVLLIERNSQETDSVCQMFSLQGLYAFELTCAESLETAEKLLSESAVDVVLLDMDLPGVKGLEAVRRVRVVAPRVCIVLLSSPGSEELAEQAMREGAQDYLVKDQIEPRELMRALYNAISRKNIEEILFVEKERALVTLDCIGDAVICTDSAGKITFLNPVAERMTGWLLKEAAGRPLTEAFHIMDATTRITTPNPMAVAAAQNRIGSLPPNCILVRRDKTEIFIEDSVAPIHDRAGLVAGSVLVFRDVTMAHTLAEKVVHASQHDPLTGLPNRLLLNDRISQAISLAQRHKHKVAVLFLDLDRFKHINDSLGHPVGDDLLQSVARRLQDCIRTPDTVSRQGGDEFVILLQDVQHPKDAVSTVRRILKLVAETHSIGNRDLHITASIGVSIFPDDGFDAETLIRNADTAMYQAKDNGRQGYRFFKQEMNILAVERQSIEEDLRGALDRNEFSLHYQPKIDIRTGKITGAEALLRWTHPTLGSIPPARFIPIAEDSGLILPIGAWVLREASLQARSWVDAVLPSGTMAVNVSAVQFRNEAFLKELFTSLGEAGLDPRLLELEVTESILMKNPELTTPILKTLRDKGVQVSVDDFGTGYSSLGYLQQFPLDAIKIDRSFVHRITTNPDDTTIVSAIISMGQSLHLRVIAEGVETSEDLSFLEKRRCDEAQGYYFSRPVPAADFAQLLVPSVN